LQELEQPKVDDAKKIGLKYDSYELKQCQIVDAGRSKDFDEMLMEDTANEKVRFLALVYEK
jgi:hypothetical protein